MTCANSKPSDEPAHPRSLARSFAVFFSQSVGLNKTLSHRQNSYAIAEWFNFLVKVLAAENFEGPHRKAEMSCVVRKWAFGHMQTVNL